MIGKPTWRVLALALLLAGCGANSPLGRDANPSGLTLQAHQAPIPTPVPHRIAPLAPRVVVTATTPTEPPSGTPSLAKAMARAERAPLDVALGRLRRGLDAAPRLSYRIRALASLVAGHASFEARASWVPGRLGLQITDSNVLGVGAAELVLEEGDRLAVFRGPLAIGVDLGEKRWATLAPWLGWAAPDVALSRLNAPGWRVIASGEGVLEGRPVKRLEVIGPADETLELAFETASPYLAAITQLGSDAQRRQLVFDQWSELPSRNLFVTL